MKGMNESRQTMYPDPYEMDESSDEDEDKIEDKNGDKNEDQQRPNSATHPEKHKEPSSTFSDSDSGSGTSSSPDEDQQQQQQQQPSTTPVTGLTLEDLINWTGSRASQQQSLATHPGNHEEPSSTWSSSDSDFNYDSSSFSDEDEDQEQQQQQQPLIIAIPALSNQESNLNPAPEVHTIFPESLSPPVDDHLADEHSGMDHTNNMQSENSEGTTQDLNQETEPQAHQRTSAKRKAGDMN
jgi:hypothetical protein